MVDDRLKVSELYSLFERAHKSCESGSSTSDFENDFVALLEFIEMNPSVCAHAKSRFLNGIAEKSLEWELIAFCMHKLRFDSVKKAAYETLKRSKDPRDRRPLQMICDSFDDAWGDRDMYSYYND